MKKKIQISTYTENTLLWLDINIRIFKVHSLVWDNFW